MSRETLRSSQNREVETHLSVNLHGATLCPRSLMVRAALELGDVLYQFKENSILSPKLPDAVLYGELPVLEVCCDGSSPILVEDYRAVLLFIEEKLTRNVVLPNQPISRAKVFDYLEVLDTQILPYLYFSILTAERNQFLQRFSYSSLFLKRFWSVVTGAPLFPLPYPIPYTAFDEDLFERAAQQLIQFSHSDALAFPLIAHIVERVSGLLHSDKDTSDRLTQHGMCSPYVTQPQINCEDYGT
jgi:hypothetical protein